MGDDSSLDEFDPVYSSSQNRGNFIKLFFSTAQWVCIIRFIFLGFVFAVLALFSQNKLLFAQVRLSLVCSAAAVSFGGFGFTWLLLHLINAFLRLDLIPNWNIFYYLKELECHIALFSWLLVLFALVNALGVFDHIVRLHLSQVLMALLLAVLLMAIKRHFMTRLAMSFNYSNYCNRIQESIFSDKIISMLSKAKHTYKFRKKFSKSKRRRSDDAIRNNHQIFPQEHKLSFDLELEKPIPTASPTTTAVNTESAKTEYEKKRQFDEFFLFANKTAAKGDSRIDIVHEARRISSKLFKYLKPNDRDHLVPQDFAPYIDDMDEYRRAMLLLKRYSDGQPLSVWCEEYSTSLVFGETDLRRAIEGMLIAQYSLVKSMKTIEMALDKVDSIFTIAIAMVFAIVVAISVGDAIQSLLALSTLLSGAAFVFSTTARNMFESIIFLLVIHPFDVGDRVYIPLGTTTISTASTMATMAGSDGLDNLIVIEMHLLSTVFERWDGVKIYVPNYVLSSKPVFNIRRSGPLIDFLRFQIEFSTPISKIDELRKRLDQFCLSEQSDFTGISRLIVDSIENCNKINLLLQIQVYALLVNVLA